MRSEIDLILGNITNINIILSKSSQIPINDKNVISEYLNDLETIVRRHKVVTRLKVTNVRK